MENTNNNFKYENKVFITGRVGMEPRVSTVGGKVVANFSVATEERYTNRSGEQVVDTTWHSINYWGSSKEGDLDPDAIHKGDAVTIRGKIRNRKYTSPDGAERTFTEIVAFGVARVSNTTEPTQPTRVAENTASEENDLPF